MTLNKGENPYIYGFHDKGGEHLLLVNGEAKGWVLLTEAIGSEAHERGGGDYRDLADKGLGVIVRLNQSYGTNGTIPREKRYPEFAQRVANYVEASKGANIWLIGNEMNFEREQPRQEGNDRAEVITPRRYATCYKMCRDKIKALPGHKDDLVIVGAIGPWNGQTAYDADPQGKYPANKIPGPGEYPYNGFFGDFMRYLTDILLAIGPENCDGVAIHAYSHGYKPEMVFNQEKMGPPFDKYYYNFFTYKDQMNAIPENMRHLPVYLTEMNGDKEGGERGPTWPFGNNGWIKNAYKEINTWNKSGKQQIRCGILFRWKIDPLGWSIDGKPDVQQDLKDAITQNYKWDPNAGQPKTSQPAAQAQPTAQAQPARPNYLARYLNHNTPQSVAPGQTIEVKLTIQNGGNFSWANSGQQPFQLGFQWFNAQGQFITFPSNLDFRTGLPRTVVTDGTVELKARLRTPDTPGSYQMRWDMVHETVTWFSSQNDPGLVLPITVTAPVITTATTKPVTITTAPIVPVTIEAEDISGSLIQHATKHYPMRTHADIKRIIVHHTATPANITVERIADFQVKNKDLPGIVYHYCITPEGKVYQTQYLETVSSHAGTNSDDSVGVCLIGNFTSNPPPQPQLDATAPLLAQIATHLGLTTGQIFGHSEVATTGSPGATWPQWKTPLLQQVQRLMSSGKPISAVQPQPKVEIKATTTTTATTSTSTAAATSTSKSIEHYLLFWHKSPNNWADWDLQGALDYIANFKPTLGFDIEQAKSAKYVTIIGGNGGIPANAERILRAAGCQVERIDGGSEEGTRNLLQELVAKGTRFQSLK